MLEWKSIHVSEMGPWMVIQLALIYHDCYFYIIAVLGGPRIVCSLSEIFDVVCLITHSMYSEITYPVIDKTGIMDNQSEYLVIHLIEYQCWIMTLL